MLDRVSPKRTDDLPVIETKPVSFRAPKDLLRQFDILAHRLHYDRTKLLVKLMEDAVEANRPLLDKKP